MGFNTSSSRSSSRPQTPEGVSSYWNQMRSDTGYDSLPAPAYVGGGPGVTVAVPPAASAEMPTMQGVQAAVPVQDGQSVMLPTEGQADRRQYLLSGGSPAVPWGGAPTYWG